MRVLVSGGTGLIGAALARSLVGSGHAVQILTRRSDRAPEPGVQLLSWDARTPDGWWREAEGCDAIVHLAGDSIDGRWTRIKKERLRASRIESGAAIREAVLRMRRRPRVLLQASAVGYYGDTGDRGDGVTEDSPPGTDFLGRLAVEWEASTRGVEDLGLRWVAARTGVVLAREGGALPKIARPIRFFAGGVLGDGAQWMPWIHRDDEVGALRFLIENEAAAGAFNLTAPRPERHRDFVRLLARALGRPAILRVPAIALRAALGEMAAVVLTGQRALPQRLLAAGYRFAFSDLESALANLYSEDPA